jgi:hypothetical protein
MTAIPGPPGEVLHTVCQAQLTTAESANFIVPCTESQESSKKLFKINELKYDENFTRVTKGN